MKRLLHKYTSICRSSYLPIPPPLWEKIETFFKAHRNNEINEGTVPGYIVGETTWMSYVDFALRNEVNEVMKPILAEWSGVGLTESAVYGIRKYTEGSTLQEYLEICKTPDLA